MLGAAILALARKELIALRESVDLSPDFGERELGSAQRFLEDADPTMAITQFLALVHDVFFELVALDDDEAVLFAGSLDGVAKLVPLELYVSELLLGGDDFSLDVFVLEVDFGKAGVGFLPSNGFGLDFTTQVLDQESIFVTLSLNCTHDVLDLVVIALNAVVALGQLVEIMNSLVSPDLGPLEVFLQAILLVKMLIPLQLPHLDAVSKRQDLLARRVKLRRGLAVLALKLSVLAEERAKLAMVSLRVLSGVVAIVFTGLELDYQSLEFRSRPVMIGAGQGHGSSELMELATCLNHGVSTNYM
jgi:hypothetical protein